MNESAPAARLLGLLALLQTGRTWSGTELADRLGVSVRTARRDVLRLRELGYAVSAQPGVGGHYRLAAGSTVPPLLFADDEVTAVVAGLRLAEHRLGDRDAAARARAKLERLLPPRLAARAAAAGEAIEVVPEHESVVDPEIIAALSDVVVAAGRVAFDYLDQRHRSSRRTVDPYRHVVRRGHWYLLGFDVDRDDWRVFRVDRIAALERVPGVFARRPLPAESVAEFLDRNFAQPPIAVSVVFTASAARVAAAIPQPNGELIALADDRCRYLTRVSSLDWFAVTTLALVGLPFVVEEPPELAGRCRALAATLSGG